MQKNLDALFLLALTLVVVPTIWTFFYSWTPEIMIGGNDAPRALILSYRDSISINGAWGEWLYRFDFLGGVRMHDVVGFPLNFRFFPLLGLGPVGAVNLNFMLSQSLLAFFCVESVKCISERFYSNIYLLLLIALFSFLPVLGWRISYGHFLNCYAMVFVAGVFFLLVAKNKNQLCTAHLLVFLFAALNVVPTANQQILVYCLIFYAVFLLSLSKIKDVIFLAWPLSGILIISWPHLQEIISMALSEDATRTLEAGNMVYSYTTANWLDWLSSIPLSTYWAEKLRHPYLLHETNYPIGPVILFLIFFPWARSRKQIIYLCVGLFFAICLSNNIKPISSWMIENIPMLSAFRVPARAFIPFAIILPIYAISGLLQNNKQEIGYKKEILTSLVGIGSVFLLSHLHAIYFEILTWSLLAISLAGIYFFMKHRGVLIVFCISTICCLNIISFKERLLPFENVGTKLEYAKKFGAYLKNKNPQLNSSLNRVYLQTGDLPFKQNSAYMAGLSSISGYWRMGRKFLELRAALDNVNYDPAVNIFDHNSWNSSFAILSKLYNVGYNAQAVGEHLALTKMPETLGPYWFSKNIKSVDTYTKLAHELQSELSAEVLWVINKSQELESFDCKEPSLFDLKAPIHKGTIAFRVDVKSRCPLTLATNHSTGLKATGMSANGEIQNLKLFPGYGALLSMIIEPEIKSIEVSFSSKSIKYAAWFYLIGLLVFLGSIAYLGKTKLSMRN